MNFTGKHVVITGGSTGIGRATAACIVAAGGKVTLIARRQDVLDAACRELGPRTSGIAADAGDKAQITAALDAAIARSGPLDGLFLNAGTTGAFTSLGDYPDDAFAEALRINAQGPFWAIRHVLPAMMARGAGAILITGSIASTRGMAGNVGYLVSKHAALGLARATAMEGAPHVRCNCIIPGFIDTPMLATVPDEARAAMEGRTPQNRIGRSEEAGAVAAFLLSDAASHVTAQSLAVDGGLLGTLEI